MTLEFWMPARMSILDQLDWTDFERLCADLLAAEGLTVESESSVDRSGVDFVAVEDYRSHDPTRVISVRWRVQCKHYGPSGTNLSRNEVEKILDSFVVRGPHDGLFIITSADFTEPANNALREYLTVHPEARFLCWNRRQLLAHLDRHQNLLKRYGIATFSPDYV